MDTDPTEFGLKPSEIQGRLDSLLEHMKSAAGRQVGFPGNQNFDYSPPAALLRVLSEQPGQPLP